MPVTETDDTAPHWGRQLGAADLVDRLLSGAPVGFALYDREHRYVRVNELLARVDGVPTAERIGRTPREVLGELGAVIEERIAQVLATEQPILYEDVVIESPGGGEPSFWTTSWYPAPAEDGSIGGVAVIALEVTARRHAEQLLQRSEERYRALVESSATDVWRADPEGYLVDDLPAWRAVTGQIEQDLLGIGWLGGIHPEDRTRARDTWAESVRGVVPYVCEFRIGPEGGPWRTMVMRGLPIVSGDEVIEWVGTTLDVTDFRSAERERWDSYHRLRAAALTLQQSILPEQTWQPEEVDVRARYVPGVEGTEVGGDWYDVIELGAGRIGLVIGDVMGRGIRAAAVMGQLRTAVRAYSRLDLPPGELLALLDGLVAELADGQIVTCAYAVYEPSNGMLHIANAGHVPPLVVRPDGSVLTLDGLVGAPLGVEVGVYAEEHLSIAPGSVLAMYTDGLVESRGEDIDDGIARLADALRDRWPDLGARCGGVLERLGRAAGSGDDVALLLVSVPEDGDVRTNSATVAVPRGIQSVGHVRQASAVRLAEWGLDDETTASALLVLNEMVTNAQVHGRAPVELLLRRTPSRLYVEVVDGSSQLPRRRLATRDDEGGRGLQMVAELSERWGVRPVDEGKAVWAAIVLPG